MKDLYKAEPIVRQNFILSFPSPSPSFSVDRVDFHSHFPFLLCASRIPWTRRSLPPLTSHTLSPQILPVSLPFKQPT